MLRQGVFVMLIRRRYAKRNLLFFWLRRNLRGIDKKIINIGAAVLAFCFLWFLVTNFIFSRKSINIPVSNVAGFQISHNIIGELKELSGKYGKDFIELLTVYCLENEFFPKKIASPTTGELEQNFIINYEKIRSSYRKEDFDTYYKLFSDIMRDMVCFPIPAGYDSDISGSYMYGDSWGAERNYDSSRPHQGTDILDRENIRGRIPIVSMTDGVLKDMGWNELGGYRIGIVSDTGTYYYYAHLHSFADNLSTGNRISAGQVIGFMGDTGYDKQEGTSGKFPVHLHVGISPNTELAREFWINPYPLLRYIESKKVEFGRVTFP